jgi:hypothetical protein
MIPGQASLLDLRDPSEQRAGKRHRGASDTERAGAAAVLPRSGTQRAAVLDYIGDSLDGRTDAEIEVALGMRRASVCGRRHELLEDGWIVDSGRRRVDRRTGLAGIVWVLSEQGEAAHA